MKLHPAEQEKTRARTKHSIKRVRPSSGRPSKQAVERGDFYKASKGHPSSEEDIEKIEKVVEAQPPTPTPLVPSPVFVRRDITAPDGSVRPGWEMWIGDHCFGRADSKALLLASFQRLQSPPESFHWREVRNRMQMRGRLRTAQPEEDKEESWGWHKKDGEETVLVEEGAEGFQELSWDTPA